MASLLFDFLLCFENATFFQLRKKSRTLICGEEMRANAHDIAFFQSAAAPRRASGAHMVLRGIQGITYSNESLAVLAYEATCYDWPD